MTSQFGTIADHVLAGTADGLLLLEFSGAERIGTASTAAMRDARWPASLAAEPLPGATSADVQAWAPPCTPRLIAGARRVSAR
ncbi:hypothetical protein AWV79_04825 [Cupriavidus sp. UYMMa02A]|nr:hypothetical protein AWV79_04825 [Cupriavidus sp. UYMMa02A]